MDRQNSIVLENYNLLKSIKPRFFQTKFPYSNYKHDKPILTETVIEILVKDAAAKDAAAKDTTNKESRSKKGGSDAMIIIYG